MTTACATTFTDHFVEVTPVRATSLSRPYRPDEAEPYLVCAFHHARKATTM